MNEENEVDSAIQNFIYLIIIPNPVKKNVRLIFDINNIRLVMKKDRFIDTISKYVDRYMLVNIEEACRDYGHPFLIDRTQNAVKRLSYSAEIERLNLKEVFEKASNKKDPDKYMDAINEYLQKVEINAAQEKKSKFERYERYSSFG